MKMYGKAHETASTILEAFRNPETLPEVIAPIFIHRKDDLPCRKWSWRNQLLTALAATDDDEKKQAGNGNPRKRGILKRYHD